MTSRFEVQVSGRVPQGLTGAIGARFGAINVRERPASTVLSGSVADQAAVRALLTLIWDTGGTVLSVTVDPDAASRPTGPTAVRPGRPPSGAPKPTRHQ
jgi:hypothetical protein